MINRNDLNIIKTKEKVEKLVIFLHGYGSSGDDLISLANEFQGVIPDACFLSPDAPFPCEIGFGYQWFSLNDRNENILYPQVQKASLILNEFIDQQLKLYSLDDKDLILVGFSQGTMMALHTALRRESACIVIGYSGMLIKGELLDTELKSKPNILLIHGDQDEVVDKSHFNSAVINLEKYDIPLEKYLVKNLGHNIDYNVIRITQEFLKSKM